MVEERDYPGRHVNSSGGVLKRGKSTDGRGGGGGCRRCRRGGGIRTQRGTAATPRDTGARQVETKAEDRRGLEAGFRRLNPGPLGLGEEQKGDHRRNNSAEESHNSHGGRVMSPEKGKETLKGGGCGGLTPPPKTYLEIVRKHRGGGGKLGGVLDLNRCEGR